MWALKSKPNGGFVQPPGSLWTRGDVNTAEVKASADGWDDYIQVNYVIARESCRRHYPTDMGEFLQKYPTVEVWKRYWWQVVPVEQRMVWVEKEGR